MKIYPIFLMMFLVLTISSARAAEYELDPTHTAVTFKVRHLLSNVNGTFDKFDGRFSFTPDKPEEWKVDAKIQADSISTRNDQRDKHLKSADFFDTEHYPELTFKSTKVTDYKNGHAKLHGILGIHGVEKEVVMDLEVLGVEKDPWGNELAGFSATTTINRKDYGLTWNQVAESGKFLVGEEVQITIDVEGKTVTLQAPEEVAAADPVEAVQEQEQEKESLTEQKLY